MLAPRSNYQNIHLCEPLSQYSSRVQLTSSSAHRVAQQPPIHGNCYFDMTPAAVMPWATLPRRHNNLGVDTFPTATKDSSTSFVTESSNRPADQAQISQTNSGMPQLTAIQQQSPTVQRQHQQSQRVIQPESPRLTRSPQKLPVKVSPSRSPVSFHGYPTVTSRCNTISPVIPATNISSRTITSTTDVIADVSNTRQFNYDTKPVTLNTNATAALPIQAGFSDMRQVQFFHLFWGITENWIFIFS